MGLEHKRRNGAGSRDPRELERLADEELIERVQGADARAFEILYERHATAAYSLAYRMMGSAGTAEDVTQDAFISAWRAAGRYSATRGSVRTWLLGIVHHRAIDALRRRNPRERREVHGAAIVERVEAPQRTDEEVAARQEAGSVRALIQDLPADQRQVIELAYFAGFTHSQIAEIVDVPLGTVKGRMRLALEKLRSAATSLEAGR
jgi:RNA polymerase sigma-70 factor (ECF subfamily)